MRHAERPQRIEDRVDHGLGRADAAGLPGALGAERVGRGRKLDQGQLEGGQVHRAAQTPDGLLVAILRRHRQSHRVVAARAVFVVQPGQVEDLFGLLMPTQFDQHVHMVAVGRLVSGGAAFDSVEKA